MLPIKYSLRNAFARPLTAGMTILAVGLVTGVFVAVFALAGGLTSALAKTGDPRTVLLLRPGAESEGQSSLASDAFEVLSSDAAIERDAQGRPLASPESIVALFLPREDGKRSNVIIRGVRPIAFTLRSEVRIVEGRMFTPGVAELVVGRRLAERFPKLRLGQKVDLGRRDYPVVGIFDASGTSYESEAYGDVDAIMGDFQRGGYSCARLRVAPGANVKELQERVKGDQRFGLEARTETEYYAGQSQSAQAIYFLGSFISIILAVGAVFTTMNTLYAAVAVRSRELATLRALGFGRFSLLLTIVIEALAISVAGWAAAILVTRLLLDGVTTGTTNFTTFSEVAFDFRVDGGVMVASLIFTCAIGIAGALLPAFRAMFTPVAAALRQG